MSLWLLFARKGLFFGTENRNKFNFILRFFQESLNKKGYPQNFREDELLHLTILSFLLFENGFVCKFLPNRSDSYFKHNLSTSPNAAPAASHLSFDN